MPDAKLIQKIHSNAKLHGHNLDRIPSAVAIFCYPTLKRRSVFEIQKFWCLLGVIANSAVRFCEPSTHYTKPVKENGRAN